jgi:assimilatory nitrate reductase catalytic subunit
MSGTTRTTCPYCGVGCGVVVEEDGTVAGDAQHPANQGRLCSKGAALGETLGVENRLLRPRIHGRDADWNSALDLVAQNFQATLAKHGPQSIGFYVSGQLLTEDYYVVNKLAKGFLGTANIDTNSRLCMASSVAGHRRAFGEDLVPGAYEDLELADLVVLVGSNAAWCHPILFQRLEAAREKHGTKIVVIDPRRTATAACADLHLAARAGTDVLLFNGLLAHLAAAQAIDRNFIVNHTAGFIEALAAAKAEARYIETVADDCGLPAAQLAQFYDWFTKTENTVTAYSQGVNQSSAGTDKVNAIINCHLATGRIGKPGMGPLSLTGQPNAMGGREVGGLANQLAAHMSFDDPAAIDRVRHFWNAPHMAHRPGLTAVDMFDAVLNGQIKALWIMGTNPAVSMPDAGQVRRALALCPFVVVSDVTAETDTAGFAHVLLPAAGWGEKDGTVTNSERRISRQRSFRAPAGEARYDWAIVTEVAHRLGFAHSFPYLSPADVFREHAALSTFENDGARCFDLGGLAALSEATYDTLEPVQWPVPAGSRAGTPRLLDDGLCPTKDRRGHFIAVTQKAPRFAVETALPLILNSGRLRDQWHTMTRTGLVPRLSLHQPEPCVDLAPADAAAHAIKDGDLVRLKSRWGTAVAAAHVTPDQPKGSIFLPMHWTDQFAADCVIGSLVNPAVDPVSHQPELKHTPVAIEKIEVGFEALLLTRRRFKPEGFLHWSRRPGEACEIYQLKGPQSATDVTAAVEALLAPQEGWEFIEYRDPGGGIARLAWVSGDGLEECLFLGPPGSLPDVTAVIGLFAQKGPLDEVCRLSFLSGEIAGSAPSAGRIICTCFQVGIETIREAIVNDGMSDVRALGKHLRTGTNCGSCIPELRDILQQSQALLAAE